MFHFSLVSIGVLTARVCVLLLLFSVLFFLSLFNTFLFFALCTYAITEYTMCLLMANSMFSADYTNTF